MRIDSVLNCGDVFKIWDQGTYNSIMLVKSNAHIKIMNH